MKEQKVKAPKCGCESEKANLIAQAAKYEQLMKALRKEQMELQNRDRVLQGRIIDLDVARNADAERKRVWEQAATMTTNECQIMLHKKDLQLEHMRAQIVELKNEALKKPQRR